MSNKPVNQLAVKLLIQVLQQWKTETLASAKHIRLIEITLAVEIFAKMLRAEIEQNSKERNLDGHER